MGIFRHIFLLLVTMAAVQALVKDSDDHSDKILDLSALPDEDPQSHTKLMQGYVILLSQYDRNGENASCTALNHFHAHSTSLNLSFSLFFWTPAGIGDHFLDATELPPSLSHLMKYDTDGDGRISATEYLGGLHRVLPIPQLLVFPVIYPTLESDLNFNAGQA